ncbi:MAG: DUF2306 domain-containing protein [Rhodobacter sp.]|nr:DUF2306 domain-containing protein [Rhodobacter sp.]
MSSVGKREWVFLAIILIYSFVPTFGGLFRVLELLGGPAIAPENPRASGSPLPIAVHILTSFLFCLVGALQFLPSIRRYHSGLHRLLGRVVAVAGCLSALTGLWMTHFYAFPQSLQGALLYWARIALSLSMFGFIAWAVVAIRSRNLAAHSAAMIRAYAIGQGASTQAMLGIGGMVVFGAELMGPQRDAMMVMAWGINLLVAEFFIRTHLVPRMRPI